MGDDDGDSYKDERTFVLLVVEGRIVVKGRDVEKALRLCINIDNIETFRYADEFTMVLYLLLLQ